MTTEKKYIGSKKSIIAVLATVLFGVIIGYVLRGDEAASVQPQAEIMHQPDISRPDDQEHAAQLQTEEKNATTVYICPMNCVPPMGQPGKCPVCGMELVEITGQGHQHEQGPPRLYLADAAVKAAGIQLAQVEKRVVEAEIRLYGRVEYDPAYQYKVTAFAPGVIDEIYVKRAGEIVKTGDALVDLYSVDLYFLEQKLFAALEKLPGFLATRPAVGQRFTQWTQTWMWKPTGPPPRGRTRPGISATQPIETEKGQEISTAAELLITAEVAEIRREIGSLGLTEAEVDGIISRGWPTGIKTEITPISGIVLKQDAFKSMYLNTGDSVFTIANPQHVWAVFDAFESDFPWIKLGQKVEFRSDAYPGEIFTGEVIYLEPYFDDKTRTVKVGVLCSDHQNKLKPGMLARGTLYATLSPGFRLDPRQSEEQKKTLAIPETAPLITGKRAVVYVEVADKPGSYEGREVVLGPRAKGYYVVRDGLHEGEKVVVNGNFKIDSAIQILTGTGMMDQVGEATPPELDSDISAMKMDMPMPPHKTKP